MSDIDSFFDINRHYGAGARGPGEFVEPAALVRHLDYLGIDRALVWNVRARDLAPVWGNRELLADIEPFRERLIPAAVITPSLVYEQGALEELRGLLTAGRIRAVRIFPEGSGFPMSAIQRLLEAIAPMRPAVFWSFHDRKSPADAADFARLAATLPDLPLVMTELMWPQFTEALDLMWRAPNLHIDTSWLHMRDAIELLCRDFGAERVLFGTGFRSHYGAAQAMLAHAQISREEKNLIASGNAERLTGLGPPSKLLSKPDALQEQKPHWRRLREGRPPEGITIIDAHTHIGPRTRGWTMQDNEPEIQIPALLAQMDACGVQRMVVAPGEALFGDPVQGNLRAEQRLLPCAERMSGYFCFNPHYVRQLTPMLDECLSRPFFAGLKILPAYWKVNLNDARYVPVWEAAQRFRLPILIHTWTDRYNSPARLAEIVPRYPDAAFLLAHSGGTGDGRQEAEDLARQHPNAFLEFCGSFVHPRDWVDTIRAVGADKIIFGSDTDAHSLPWELGRFLSIPLPDAELEPMLGANFLRLLARKRTLPDAST